MAFPDIFTAPVTEGVVDRIQALDPRKTPLWGKMSAPQMLAHCNVTYEMVYTDKHPKPGLIMGFILKRFVKKYVCTEVPFQKGNKTAPAFIITGDRDFTAEKERLIAYLRQVQQEGGAAFEGRTSNSFGPLTREEWNVMFYKHLDHHLSQFGV